MGIALVGSPKKPSPALSDIPGQLRRMADEIERQKDPDLVPLSVLVLKTYPDAEVTLGTIGEMMSKAEIVGTLHLAQGIFSAKAGRAVRYGDAPRIDSGDDQ